MIFSWTIIGAVVGLLLGLTGAGGAVIAVPLFVYLADASIRDATTLSLIAVLAGSVLNWIFQFRATDYRTALLLFTFSAMGSFALKPLKAESPEWLLTALFLLVTLWSLTSLWKKQPAERRPAANSPVKHRLVKTSAGGFALGGLITMTGLGGGVMLVPFLRGVFRVPMKRAASTSLLIILLSSIFSLWIQRDGVATEVSIGPVLALFGGTMASALAARSLSENMKPKRLDRLRLGLITAVILVSAGSLIVKATHSTEESKTMNIQTTDMKSLKDIHAKLGPKEKILDVRTPEEFAEGHVPGAINIDHENVGKHLAELAQYDKIYVHCRSGKRAEIAMNELGTKGLKNLVLVKDSGMIDWTEAGFPEEKGGR